MDTTTKTERKDKKKEHRHGRFDDEHLDDDDDNGSPSRRSKKSHKKRKKQHGKKRKRHEKRKKRRSSDHYSSEDSSVSDGDSSSRSDRRSKKKKRKKEKRRKHNDDDVDNKYERNYQFANALHDLLTLHPGLATDLPIMLIRLAGGTTLDFSQVSDPTAGQGLNRVMESLRPFGVCQQNGAWTWNGSTNNSNDLVLIKVVRALLSEIGVSVDAFLEFDRKHKMEAEKEIVVKEAKESTKVQHNNDDDNAAHGIRQQTQDLLMKFEQHNDTSPHSQLTKELIDICNLVLSGETIDLQGLPNEELRGALESLFKTVGLEMFEMELDDEEDQDDDSTPGMGYGIADGTSATARENLATVVQECCSIMEKGHSKTTAQPRRVLGPSLPPPATGMEEEFSSDDEQGPAPAGSAMAKKRVPRGPARMPVKEADSSSGTKREEWMMVPGEHDFLQGIKSGPIKNRSFKNEKQRQAQEPQAALPPEVQAQMDAIQQAHENSRGPSLMEQHRSKKQAEKNTKSAEWKWNREKDLDEGRRVDKNALHMVMGGAKGELKSKFQGGYSKGFM